VSDWHGLYSEGWQNEIVPDAFSHPAKYARGLIRRIYEHAIEEGWLVEGDTVIDPFAGVALGGLDAMFHGLHWIGCELEEKFVGLGGQNIALWNSRYGNGMLPRWGTAVILQGDSRNLVDVLDGASANSLVSSPPWYTPQTHNRGHIMDTGTPAMKRCQHSNAPAGYVPPSTRGNLGNMREGDHVKACISSPPFVNAGTHQASNEADERELRLSKERRTGPGGRIGISQTTGYGQSPGQLAALPEGDLSAQAGVRAVVSSPPWEKQMASHDDFIAPHDTTKLMGINYSTAYGNSQGQLGTEQGDTFWSAARVIVSQCYQVLAPGGVAIWVTKAFVRNKAIVDFPEQWRELCESYGFETLHKHRCWLVEDRGGQYALNGDLVQQKVERKSFFRRLYEKKYPENSIDYEVVWCMRKPTDAPLFADVAVREGI
jgi:hypothetical protein